MLKAFEECSYDGIEYYVCNTGTAHKRSSPDAPWEFAFEDLPLEVEETAIELKRQFDQQQQSSDLYGATEVRRPTGLDSSLPGPGFLFFGSSMT